MEEVVEGAERVLPDDVAAATSNIRQEVWIAPTIIRWCMDCPPVHAFDYLINCLLIPKVWSIDQIRLILDYTTMQLFDLIRYELFDCNPCCYWQTANSCDHEVCI